MAEHAGKMRMLVIDDETVVLESCQRIFTEEGFDVTTTGKAKEGLELAHQHRLPEPIFEAIEQHHGTRLIKFFYRRAQERADRETERSAGCHHRILLRAGWGICNKLVNRVPLGRVGSGQNDQPDGSQSAR